MERPPRRSLSKPAAKALTFKGVDVRLDGRTVLSGIDWEVGRGESWAVIGPNGAGKTTLLSVINGYRWPTRGEVSVLGQQFGSSDLRDLRRRLGMVSSYLNERISGGERVLDVVLTGNHGSTHLWRKSPRREERRAESLLKMVGCLRHRNKQMAELSQGERQRVLIARALAPRPRLLTLDEPCEGLDLKARELFLSTLSTIAKRRDLALVDVTHRTDEIPSGFSHALLLKDGKKISSGPIEQVMTGANLSRCFDVRVSVKRIGNRYYTIA